MPKIVFWDTAAFVALGNSADSLHAAAIAISRGFEQEKSFTITTDAVLTEVANTFSKAAWRATAQNLIDAIHQSVELGAAELVHIDERLWHRGWQLFTERPDKDWSLTDCISFVVMQERQITTAFTSDRHFEQAGFTRLIAV